MVTPPEVAAQAVALLHYELSQSNASAQLYLSRSAVQRVYLPSVNRVLVATFAVKEDQDCVWQRKGKIDSFLQQAYESVTWRQYRSKNSFETSMDWLLAFGLLEGGLMWSKPT